MIFHINIDSLTHLFAIHTNILAIIIIHKLVLTVSYIHTSVAKPQPVVKDSSSFILLDIIAYISSVDNGKVLLLFCSFASGESGVLSRV